MREPIRPEWALEGRSAALAAFDRSDDGADLALMTGESVHVGENLRSTGGGAPPRTTLRFEHEDLAVDLWVHARGRLRSVSGLVSGEYAVLYVRRADSTERLRPGEDGGFTLSGLTPGPMSLSLRRRGRPPVVTGWFTI